MTPAMKPVSSTLQSGRVVAGVEDNSPRRRDARRRLHCIAGHLHGIGGMVDTGFGRDACDQIRAVRRAMNCVTLLLLEEHLEGDRGLVSGRLGRQDDRSGHPRDLVILLG